MNQMIRFMGLVGILMGGLLGGVVVSSNEPFVSTAYAISTPTLPGGGAEPGGQPGDPLCPDRKSTGTGIETSKIDCATAQGAAEEEAINDCLGDLPICMVPVISPYQLEFCTDMGTTSTVTSSCTIVEPNWFLSFFGAAKKYKATATATCIRKCKSI